MVNAWFKVSTHVLLPLADIVKNAFLVQILSLSFVLGMRNDTTLLHNNASPQLSKVYIVLHLVPSLQTPSILCRVRVTVCHVMEWYDTVALVISSSSQRFEDHVWLRASAQTVETCKTWNTKCRKEWGR
jgi:hypothetical protein